MNNKVFCKTSKSNINIADYCIEPYFVPYKTGCYSYAKNEGKKLSFVPIETAILTLNYGDTLSIFSISDDDLNNCHYIGGALNEWEADKLFTKQQFKLNDINTLCYVIRESNIFALSQCLNMNCGPNSFYINHFLNLNFIDASDFWKNVLYYYNNAPGSYDEKALYIHDNSEGFSPWLIQEKFDNNDIVYDTDYDLDAEEIELY